MKLNSAHRTILSMVATMAILSVVETGLAQTTNTVTETTTSTSTSNALSRALAEPNLIGGLKSYNDAGKIRELRDPSGKQFQSKNEYFAGVKTKAGWGLMAQAVETSANYGSVGAAKNNLSPRDPSFSIMHPVYKSDHLTITGMFREYFPVANYSVSNHIWQQAYYNFISYKMANRWDLNNVLIPRYFSADHYNELSGKAPDTTFYTENFLSVSRRASNWFRYGIGAHAQVEVHQAAPVGKNLDIYPMADFLISNTIFIGPRFYFPVAAQNSVYDGDTGVNMDNVQAEIYLQATL